MPYAVVAEKLKAVPECYLDEVSEFLDFLLYKTKKEENGLDKAITEVKHGNVDYYNTFDDMIADLKNA